MPDGLRPGVALFDVPGHGSALRDTAGRLVGVDLPAADVDALRRWFGAPHGDPPDGLDEELAAFARAGHLGTARRWPTDRRRVAVLADASDPALAHRIVDGLGAAGAAPETVDPADLTKFAPHAVCAAAGAPAPEAWTGLDDLPARGVAWQRISVEGRHGVLEPVAADAQDVRHADVRARRLAAAGSGYPHLAAYWTAGTPAALDDADRTLLAALAVADLRAWAVGRADGGDGGPGAGSLVPAALPARRRLRIVDLDGGAIADHPVLPVPDSAP